MSEKSDTPRTDIQAGHAVGILNSGILNLARQLERELNEANRQLADAKLPSAEHVKTVYEAEKWKQMATKLAALLKDVEKLHRSDCGWTKAARKGLPTIDCNAACACGKMQFDEAKKKCLAEFNAMNKPYSNNPANRP